MKHVIVRMSILCASVASGWANGYENLTVHYVDVGPGNCVLLNCPGEDVNLLLDCGSQYNRINADASLKVIELAHGHKTNVILSHSDKDHHNFLPVIFSDSTKMTMGTTYLGDQLSRYKDTLSALRLGATGLIYGVENINSTADPQLPQTSRSKRNRDGSGITYTYKEVRRLNVATTTGNLGTCGNADVRILAGNSDPSNWGTKTNEQSLVVSVSWAGRRFIFPGDATNGTSDQALKKALQQWARVRSQPVPTSFTTFNPNLKVDFMMAPHHGSDTHGSDWNGWGEVTRPDRLVFSGNPASGNSSFRHPKESSYNAYAAHLASTPPHVLEVGLSNALTYKDAVLGRTTAYVNPLPITTAAFSTGQLHNISVEVSGLRAGESQGEIEVKCKNEWCRSSFFNVEPSASDPVDLRQAGTKIETIDSVAYVNNSADPGAIRVTLLDEQGNPRPNVAVEFVAILRRAQLTPQRGVTDANGRFNASVTPLESGTGQFIAKYDSNADATPDKEVINGSPATVYFYDSSGGGGNPS